jgi:hypothetical protein
MKELSSENKNQKIEIKPMGSYFEVDDNGYIINPTSPDKIQSQWQPVIDNVSDTYQRVFGEKLQNVYIRGSVAKGQAVENVSDIDTFAYVDMEKDEIDYDWVSDAEKIIVEQYPFVEGVEFSVSLASSAEKNHIILNQSLCVYGEPIDVSRLKIDRSLAIHAPGFNNRLEGFERFLEQEKTPEQVKSHCVWQMKGLLRVGAEITLERSKKYTRDLYKCYEVFSEYYPKKETEMREVLNLVLNPSEDKQKIKEVMDDLGVWLLAESKKYFS